MRRYGISIGEKPIILAAIESIATLSALARM